MSWSPCQKELLETERWAWLADFVNRWYAVPLTEQDGSGAGEIAQAERRIGMPLPEVLVEWFTLIGRRLRGIQDQPVTLATMEKGADGWVVWAENQYVWRFLVGVEGSCVLDREDDDSDFPALPFPQIAQAMLFSETLVAAWSNGRVGPLGDLATQVVGGHVEDVSAERMRDIEGIYAALPILNNPFLGKDRPRGDDSTFLRGDEYWGMGLEWMTASKPAFKRLNAILDLDHEQGLHEVLLAFEGLTDSETLLLAPGGVPDMSRFDPKSLGCSGHLGVGELERPASDGLADARFRIATPDPDETVAALRGAIPTMLLAKAIIAVRPERIMKFRIVFPEGRTDHVLPL